MKHSTTERKEYLVSLLGGQCCRCGFSGDVAVFHFHHKRPHTKIYSISAGLRSNADDFENHIVPEVREKCWLLCANCHAIIHANKKEWAYLIDDMNQVMENGHTDG